MVILTSLRTSDGCSDRRDELRLTATMAVGVLKLALEDWRKSEAARPLSEFIDRAFRLLKASLRLD